MFNFLVNDPEVRADWDLANFTAVKKLKYNDHGEVHAKIVCALALKMLDILIEEDIITDFIKEGEGDEDDEHLIVTTASLLHDIGNQIFREDHLLHSSYLPIPIFKRFPPKIYLDLENRTEIRDFILNEIYVHDADIPDLTIEAVVVGIGDATDTTKRIERISYDLRSLSIHTISLEDSVTLLHLKEEVLLHIKIFFKIRRI